MRLTPTSEIIIPDNRQRAAFPPEKNEELKESIRTKGLLNPITLRADGKTLVAGERRLKAMIELHQNDEAFTCDGVLVPSGQIPFNFLGELSTLEIEEAEYEENAIRLDLSWQERALALSKLKLLREQQASAKNEVHTAADLIAELSGEDRQDRHHIREALHISKFLNDPEVAKAKTQKEAQTLVRRKLETEHRKNLSEQAKALKTPHRILHDDCVSALAKLENNLFDLILTDPPYGIGAHAFGDQAGVIHNYEDSEENALKLYKTLAIEGFRVAKPEAHAYVFCTPKLFFKISEIFAEAGWRVWPRPLIWSKLDGMLPRPQHGPRYTYEFILFASKGDRKTLCVKPDVIQCSMVQDQIHAAEKPVNLLRDLISRSCLPGSKILDPFAGSGSAIIAAELSQCNITAIEINEANYHMCLSRIHEMNLEL